MGILCEKTNDSARREREIGRICILAQKGLSRKEIADDLCLATWQVNIKCKKYGIVTREEYDKKSIWNTIHKKWTNADCFERLDYIVIAISAFLLIVIIMAVLFHIFIN